MWYQYSFDWACLARKHVTLGVGAAPRENACTLASLGELIAFTWKSHAHVFGARHNRVPHLKLGQRFESATYSHICRCAFDLHRSSQHAALQYDEGILTLRFTIAVKVWDGDEGTAVMESCCTKRTPFHNGCCISVILSSVAHRMQGQYEEHTTLRGIVGIARGTKRRGKHSNMKRIQHARK